MLSFEKASVDENYFLNEKGVVPKIDTTPGLATHQKGLDRHQPLTVAMSGVLGRVGVQQLVDERADAVRSHLGRLARTNRVSFSLLANYEVEILLVARPVLLAQQLIELCQRTRVGCHQLELLDQLGTAPARLLGWKPKAKPLEVTVPLRLTGKAARLELLELVEKTEMSGSMPADQTCRQDRPYGIEPPALGQVARPARCPLLEVVQLISIAALTNCPIGQFLALTPAVTGQQHTVPALRVARHLVQTEVDASAIASGDQSLFAPRLLPRRRRQYRPAHLPDLLLTVDHGALLFSIVMYKIEHNLYPTKMPKYF